MIFLSQPCRGTAPSRRTLTSAVAMVLVLAPLIGGCSRQAVPSDTGTITIVRERDAIVPDGRPLLRGRLASVPPVATTPEAYAANVVLADDGPPLEGWQADAQDEVASAWKRSEDPYRVQDAIVTPEDQDGAS